ncbi:MAG: Acetophenone carboxylase gamma subunit [Pseudomonadota bacterium]
MDQGGTFTDVVRRWPDGRVAVEKVLSDTAALDALAAGAAEQRRGTTVATNALLERRGAPVVLVTTAGLEDLAAIGDQTRPALFSLFTPRPPPLCARVIGVDVRITAAGALLGALDVDALDAALAEARAAGCTAAAVALVHGPRRPALERQVADRCAAAGFSPVSIGHEISPAIGFLDRLQTTLADAATSGLLPRAPGLYLRSDGGLAQHDDEGWRGCHALLSGPAGGAVATAAVARAAGVGAALGLDMGGTSTDVCRVDPEVERAEAIEVGGVRCAVPSVRISTVAAGGGSLLRVESGVYRVGPESAGARPGPAAYGRGGPATLTDADAVLGRLPGFPAVCGLGRDAPLDLRAAEDALQALDPAKDPGEIAAGFHLVAHEALARAVRATCAERGVDPADHALVAFGGAGPGHACAVARLLGISTVLVPDLAGVLSAVGIGLSRRRATARAPVGAEGLGAALRGLADRAPTFGPPRFSVAARAPETEELVELPLLAAEAEGLRSGALAEDSVLERLRAALAAALSARLGGAAPAAPQLELVELRLSVEAEGDPSPPLPALGARGAATARQVAAVFDGRWRDVPCVGPDDVRGLRGPAFVLGQGCTVVVEDGWVAHREAGLLRLVDHRPSLPRLSARFHPVHTAVFASRIAAVAEGMGSVLSRAARSVSIRERRDFSCAVFDRRGVLAVNAPHVPVHLGAMGQTVRALLAEQGGALGPGQAWVTNDPARGGSHLPDITVMQPVFVDGDDLPVAFVACRGHHVDVGGKRPGSMAPDARTRAEEGLVLPIQLLALDGDPLPLALPGCRRPAEVHADLRAQVRCCAHGAATLGQLIGDLGLPVFLAQLQHIQRAACWSTEALLATLQGTHRAVDQFDDGSPLALQLHIAEGHCAARVEAPAHQGSLNAPVAVLRAALLYSFRCLSGGELPMNEGALTPFSIEVNPGGLLDPGPEAAVAGGNVETSQRLVDLILGALGVAAASQGTMNNLCIGFLAEGGADGPTLYETIGGGGGAGPGHAGLSACQVHMTNTRATDVEVLEARFPLRLLRWGLRRGAGGAGQWPGGDGTVKEWELLAPAEVCLLAGRRTAGAPGAAGGGDGAPGVDLRDVGQGWEPAPLVWTAKAGDRLRVETPGGGGWGPAAQFAGASKDEMTTLSTATVV